MKVGMWLVLGWGVLGTSLSAYAGVARCQNFEGAKCDQIRNAAVAQGCVSAHVARALKAANRVPMCVGATRVGECKCGCFAPSVLLEMEDGQEITAEDVYAEGTTLWTLDPNSRWDSPRLSPKPIHQRSTGKEARYLVGIELDNGRRLRLTEGHPLVLDSGLLTTARHVTRGARLAGRDGKPVRVTGVTREAYEGDVFNFGTEGDSLRDHVLVAEQVLVGDLALQNALDEEEEGLNVRGQP